jgi:hypothetical protein
MLVDAGVGEKILSRSTNNCCLHGSARQVNVIGYVAFYREAGAFHDHACRARMSTDEHQTWHVWLSRTYHRPCKFLPRSDARGRQGIGMMKYTNCGFSTFFLFSHSVVPVYMVRFSSLIRQTTCSVRKCATTYWYFPQLNFRGSFTPKPPIFPKS